MVDINIFMSYKGRFRAVNPQKYKGDPSNIVYRSRWELKLMGHLDAHPDVLQWSSEEVVIPYRSPIDGRIHRYFVDFYVKKKTSQGIEEVLIEVKPKAQTAPPQARTGKPTRRYINEVHTWGINEAKWNAAKDYCMSRGWKFVIMTEHELGIK